MMRVVSLAFASALLLCAAPALAQQVAPAPAHNTSAASMASPGAASFTSEADAKAHCGSDTVVWVNTRSKVYHFAGSTPYGKTKRGAYMCRAAADAAGDRAVKNEKISTGK